VFAVTAPDVFARARSLKRAVPSALAATLVLSAVGTAARAEPNKAQYELQERCGKDAAAFFKRFNAPGGASYTDHYNPDLNGCFALLNLSEILSWGGYWPVWELWNVNENRRIDVIGFQSKPDGANKRPLTDCMLGNFVGCSQLDSPVNHDGYLSGFAASVQTYMQRSSAN